MSKRVRQYRKRKALEEQERADNGDDSDEDNSISLREKLEGAKMLQRLRARIKGYDASSLALGCAEGPDSDSDGRAKGMLGNAIDLSAAFNKEELVDTQDEDPNAKKYIEQELARIRGKSVAEGAEGGSGQDAAGLPDEEDLYHVPEDLRVPKKEDDGQADLGESWAAGIQEVPLSLAYKLKNIEDTEAAKKALLERSAKRANIADPFGDDSLPKNFKDISANASRDMFVRQFGKDQWRGPPGSSDRHGKARDDEVVAKFKRDQRARWGTRRFR
uniref:Uncharacterized protein n=1 Tax=Tetraselmis sp. GSL018 TaxID=582737 RepID=A0A061S1A5_9CHLO|mmetsp:Transcript_29400/g.70042  ORF Transcript_29400/g.70042 Transcript_29400/m.70042 type:complete len:274 (-) Transcript_29400:136-957(-)